MEAIHMYSTL